MALDLGTLTGFLDLETAKFERKLDGAKGKFGKFAGKLGKVAAVGTAAAVTAVGAFAVSGVKQFASFEKGMNEVFTLLPGISDKAMGDMTEDTRKFVREMGVAHEDAVPALYSALSAGVDKDNVFNFMETAQKTAMGGVTDLDTAVNGLTGVINAYGEDAIDADKASDLMFTTVKLGKTTVGELSQSLGDVTPLASAMGVSFEDVSAAMATSTKITGNTAKSTTGLKGLLSELGKEGQGAAKEFERISGKSFPDFIKGGGDLQGALQLMEEDTKKSGGSMVDLFGSVEAGQSALQLTGSNTESFSSALKEMDNSAGATDKAFQQMDQGLDRSWEKIKIGVADAAIGFGQQLAPAVAEVSNWIGENLPDAMEKAGNAIQKIVDFLGVAIPAAMDTLSAAVSNVMDFFERFGTALKVAGIVIGVALIPALARLGAAAVVSAYETAALWLMYKVEAIKAAAVFVAQSAIIVAKWALMGVQATINAAKVVAGWVAMAASAVAQGAVMAVSAALTAAKVVAGWVLMGAQSLIQAARMAAAWFIALGPVGWIIATVIALTALIIANWDKIKAGTIRIFKAVAAFASDVWRNIKNAVVGFVLGLVTAAINHFVWMRDKVTYWFNVVKLMAIYVWTTIRDKVVGFVVGLAKTVVDKFIWLRDKVSSWFNKIKDLAIAVWSNIRDKVVGYVVGMVKKAVDEFISFRDKVKGIFNAVKDFFTSVWRDKIRPVFQALGDFIVDKVVPLFEKGVDKIKSVWSSIEKFAKKPISFVIDTVINKGLIGAFNKVASWIPGVGKLDPVKIKGFSGGGYTGPGGVNQAAGVVHAGEVVFDQHAVAKAGGPQALDSFRMGLKRGQAKLPGYSKGGLVNPMPPGNRGISAGLYGYPGHAGTDYPAPVGTVVRSPGKGTVSNVGWNLPGGTGKQVWINHVNGLMSRVHHLSKWLVHKGQSVNAGTPVGKVGMTGNTTGPHAHWGVMDGRKYLNPASVWGSGRGGGGNFAADGGGGGGGFSLSAFTDLAKGLGAKFAAKFPDGGRLMDLTKGIGSKAIQASKDWVSDKWEGLKDNVGSAWSGVKNFVGMGSSKDKVRHVAKGYGWNKGDQWRAIDSIVSRESGWDLHAANPNSNARGLFQKMTSAHGAIEATAEGQAKWGLNYMKSRYGDPVGALAHWQKHNSYADGGPMRQGWKLVGEEGPELINTGAGHAYTATQTKRMLAKPEALYTNAENHSLQTLAARGNGVDGHGVAGRQINYSPTLNYAGKTPEQVLAQDRRRFSDLLTTANI